MIKKPLEVKCAICGRTIITMSPNRKYCSAECRAKGKEFYNKMRQDSFRSLRKKGKPPEKRENRNIDSVEYCRNYAENQKQETLRLLREGKL